MISPERPWFPLQHAGTGSWSEIGGGKTLPCQNIRKGTCRLGFQMDVKQTAKRGQNLLLKQRGLVNQQYNLRKIV